MGGDSTAVADDVGSAGGGLVVRTCCTEDALFRLRRRILFIKPLFFLSGVIMTGDSG
jgi:hypothetical protein